MSGDRLNLCSQTGFKPFSYSFKKPFNKGVIPLVAVADVGMSTFRGVVVDGSETFFLAGRTFGIETDAAIEGFKMFGRIIFPGLFSLSMFPCVVGTQAKARFLIGPSV